MPTHHLQRWLQLTLSYPCNAARLKALYERAGSLDVLLTLPADVLLTLGAQADALKVWQHWQVGIVTAKVAAKVDSALAWAAQPGHHILVYGDAHYPPLLYACSDPPPQLFVDGNPSLLSLPQVAIVGSRHPTADGRKLAQRFSRELAESGYQITSGLALGIDVESHLAALAQGATTIAVLGSGIDLITPPSHQRIAAQIVVQGAVISEFPPGTGAEPWHFPERNRIISGLAHGVLVVEAAERSGSLITARLAAEQGREVFAVPGSINNAMARGCHRLIRQGAKLVEKVEDILEELPALVEWERSIERERVVGRMVGRMVERTEGRAEVSAPLRAAKLASTRKAPVHAATDKSRPLPNLQFELLPQYAEQVLAQLAYDPLPLDSLALATALAIEQLLPCLLQLELSGIVEARASGYVRLST
jgi:DNA processing protein